MNEGKELEELIAAKMAAGLPRSTATEVAKAQLAHDAELEKAETVAEAKKAKTKTAKSEGGAETK